MEGYDNVKTPFGPLDVHTDMEEINKLIEKPILYANHREGLGYYGKLLNVDPIRSYPYEIEIDHPPYNRIIHARWIVEN